MLKKNKWIVPLLKRDWHKNKDLLKRQFLIQLCLIVVVCMIYVIFSEGLGCFKTYILSLPEAVYSLFGVSDKMNGSNIYFYIHWALLLLNIWIMRKQCKGAVESVWREEFSGYIFLMCNQLYSREQIFIAKYIWSVLNFLCNYTLFYLAILLPVGLSKAGDKLTGILGILMIYGKSVLVFWLFISVTITYAVFAPKKRVDYFTDLLIFIPLVIGNIGKLRDVIILLIQRANGNYEVFFRFTRWIDGLKWLSPLSYMNPFTYFSAGEELAQVIICIVLSLFLYCLGKIGYRIRRFE